MPKYMPANRMPIDIKGPFQGTADDPTMTYLLSQPDKSGWVSITVPKTTRATNIRYQPIKLNKWVYEPGKTYTLPPEIAGELKASIDRYEDSIVKQLVGNKLHIVTLPGAPAEMDVVSA
mgnify:CR=1 FL=1